MEWTEAHDFIQAKEVRASEPWIFKPRTVDGGKVWNAITDRLNDETSEISSEKEKCTGTFQTSTGQIQG